MAIALGLISAIIVVKYKPMYKVSIAGELVGYVQSEKEFAELIKSQIIEKQGENIDFVTLDIQPNYELELVSRNQETNDNEIILALQEKATTVYKYFAVVLNNETQAYVSNVDEAEKVVNDIKTSHQDAEIALDLQVIEYYTENADEVNSQTVEAVEEQVENKVEEMIEEDLKTKLPSVNGILLAMEPMSGLITSRFGARSSIRSGAHTGTDIAAPVGTQIKAVANGTVVFSGNNGPYGNLVRIDHGNGVETWYAHCKDLFVQEGETVKAGDIISSVGMTGNTTGAHLHLEIRIDGVAINPQQYLYN